MPAASSLPLSPQTPPQLASKRRIILLSLLHARPHSRQELIAKLDQERLFDYDRFENEAIKSKNRLNQFRRDCNALKKFGFTIEWVRQTDCYHWHNSPFGLHLNPAQLSAFALLLDTFEEAQILHSAELQDLLAHLTALLPADQQAALRSKRPPPFTINLRETTDYIQADPATVAEIEKAIRSGQQLEFRYVSPRDGREKHHRIEPRPLVFQKGHVYLPGYSLPWQQEWDFRLDYIVPGSAHMLPDTIALVRPSRPSYTLKYWLSARIARKGVSQHFDGQQIERHDDGSTTVTATTTNLFEAKRILLAYGDGCRVLAPPELVAQMRQTVEALHNFYCNSEG